MEDVNTRQLCSRNFKNIRLNGSHFGKFNCLWNLWKLLGKIDPFTVFSTFHIDKLGEIRRHHWKERLVDISETAKFESDASYASEDIAPQSCENLQTFVWWWWWEGAQTSPSPSLLPSIETNGKCPWACLLYDQCLDMTILSSSLVIFAVWSSYL